MALDRKQLRLIEQYLDLSTGYVLHYTNKTFEEFFSVFDIDIYDDKYADIGTSKGKRMRSFFNQHDDVLIGRVLLEMINEHDIERESKPSYYSSHNDVLRQHCIDIALELTQSKASVPATSQPQPFVKAFQASSQSSHKAPSTIFMPNTSSTSPSEQTTGGWGQPATSPVKEKVFIVHGHDEHLLVETENLCRKLGLDPIILKNQYSGGNTIIEKLEEYSNVTYAIVLYTACDEGRKIGSSEIHQRARQNVVFEHGYFIGKLGRRNVAAVVKGNIEIQGDISGVVYIQHQHGWGYQLASELKGSGLQVDLNHV